MIWGRLVFEFGAVLNFPSIQSCSSSSYARQASQYLNIRHLDVVVRIALARGREQVTENFAIIKRHVWIKVNYLSWFLEPFSRFHVSHFKVAWNIFCRFPWWASVQILRGIKVMCECRIVKLRTETVAACNNNSVVKPIIIMIAVLYLYIVLATWKWTGCFLRTSAFAH
jgi:hypothetical protein